MVSKLGMLSRRRDSTVMGDRREECGYILEFKQKRGEI